MQPTRSNHQPLSVGMELPLYRNVGNYALGCIKNLSQATCVPGALDIDFDYQYQERAGEPEPPGRRTN